MPIFLDGHGAKKLSLQEVNKIVNEPDNKNKVTHLEVLYNETEKKQFCITEAPSKKAVEKHHKDIGIDCDFVVEVSSAKSDSLLRTQRLSAIGELSARIAHDLRNPLGIIKNAIELIEMSSKDNVDEKLEKRLGMIKKASDRMSRQINDVLDFVRTRPPELEKKSLAKILESSIKSNESKTVKISKPKNDVKIMCDSKQLEVAFGNIITNAIQAVGDSGKIKIRLIDNKDDVQIEIEDSGPGIPADKIEQIFDPLFTTKPSGTGLGLVSCKNIVEQHGGKISVRNNPTIFEISLPKK